MKKILLTVVALVVLLVVGVIAAALMRPADYRFERSILTTAQPNVVYGIMCDFGRYGEWSPFAKLDPAAKTSVTGTPCMVGSSYAWDGNDNAGAGTMTIVDTQPGQSVRIKLDFTRPMPDVADVIYGIVPDGGQTKITWVMSGTSANLQARVFTMLFMEKMLGQLFDEGLANVKKLAEAGSH